MSSNVVTVIERVKVDAINHAHQLCQRTAAEAKEHALECGRMLAAVKADLAHGDWLPWVKENFDGSADTAQLYMRFAANPERVPEFASVRDGKRQLAQPRASSPRAAIGMVGGLEDDDVQPAANAEVRVGEQPARQWTDQHSNRRRRILALADEACQELEHASDAGLNAHARAERLRSAEIKFRQAMGHVGDLAFGFER